MKRALVISRNLIGDGLMILPVVKALDLNGDDLKGRILQVKVDGRKLEVQF